MIKTLPLAMQDDPYQGGHFSTNKMISEVSSRHWWPYMRHTTISFYIIGMDYCGSSVKPPRTIRHVLVISDLFTRFVTAAPLSTNTAELTPLTLFRHIFCKYSVCSTLITDQGSHFNNNPMQTPQHLVGYDHILNTLDRSNDYFINRMKILQVYHRQEKAHIVGQQRSSK